jgi:hypothetical protein
MATTKKTPRIPYCAECGGTNVTTTAWVEWREDGTERPTNDEGPFCGEDGNWCSDCDEHVEIVYPESMMTPRACKRRMANTAAREHGPKLLQLLRGVLDAIGEATVDGDEKTITEALEFVQRFDG